MIQANALYASSKCEWETPQDFFDALNDEFHFDLDACALPENANIIVLLVHARTDTKWFHRYLYQKPNVELRFVKGRLKFGGADYNAPFPSMIAIMRKDGERDV